MPDPSSVGPEKTVPAKKPFWNARNIIGLIILVGVLVVGWFEYSAVLGFNNAVSALDTRTQAEDKELMSIQEAESLLGKEADGPAVDFKQDIWSYDKKTYTWRGLLKQHILTAYYTKGLDPRLHHFETEGSKYELKPVENVDVSQSKTAGGPASKKGPAGKGGNRGMQPQPTLTPDAKGKTAEPSDKAGTAKPEPGDKAATPKTGPSGGAPSPKSMPPGYPMPKPKDSAPSDKAGTPKPELSDKTATPKSTPPSDPAPKAKASAPSDTSDKPK